MLSSAVLIDQVVRTRDAQMRVQEISATQVDATVLERWRNLSARSQDGNPFLSPEFVLASWKYLTPEDEHILLIVEDEHDCEWLAAGVFKQRQMTTRIPVPHALASNSPHTYRTGLLWDFERGPRALDAMLAHASQSPRFVMGLEWRGLRLDSRLARELEAAARRQRVFWQSNCERQVPAIFPPIVTREYIDRHWSKNRRKSYRRNRVQLESLGEVNLRFVTSSDEIEPALETFLRLEAGSWKGEAGTACLSTPADSQFVREMVTGLAESGHVLISELTLNGRVIASALNLVGGTTFYAFKIGWDREFTSVGPGILHECELLFQSADRLGQYTLMDSCAAEDSYLADYWPERIPVGHVVICWSAISELALHLSNAARTMKRMVRSMWQA